MFHFRILKLAKSTETSSFKMKQTVISWKGSLIFMTSFDSLHFFATQQSFEFIIVRIEIIVKQLGLL